MSDKETGGPAFPVADPFLLKPGNEKRMMEIAGGMTLRDYFSAKAMQSFLTNQPPHVTDMTYAEWASDSYQMADAMLKARQ